MDGRDRILGVKTLDIDFTSRDLKKVNQIYVLDSFIRKINICDFALSVQKLILNILQKYT